MKETYSFSINLPFGDMAEFDYEMTEEEYDEFLEFCNNYSIWEEEQFEMLLSAAATAAADYIVGFYCEDPDAADVIDDYSCTVEKLMEYLYEYDDEAKAKAIAEVFAGDGQDKRDRIVELLEEQQAFTLSDG